jgi:hypothetical protein
VASTLNLTGRRIGKLTVLRRSPRREKRGGGTFWICMCDCGKETHVRAYWLNSRRTKSCGCYRRTFKILPGDEASFNQLYQQYRDNARHKGLEMSLLKNEFRRLTERPCAYCGALPRPTKILRAQSLGGHVPEPYLGNGIDRVDNSEGYVLDNCVPCCSTCNYMKRGLGFGEFITQARKIALHGGKS